MDPETEASEPWRQSRRSNNPTGRVHCPTSGADPGWRCSVSTAGANRWYSHHSRVPNSAVRSREEMQQLVPEIVVSKPLKSWLLPAIRQISPGLSFA